MTIEFKPFPKVPRLSREVVITEKLDGTNACVHISEDGVVRAASRTRWIAPDNDNYGFAVWVRDNNECLSQLGEGYHFGEWWGQGIQRRYGLSEKRFSLFNVSRWLDAVTGRSVAPECCSVVPLLYKGVFDSETVEMTLWRLGNEGSYAAPGFDDPEGIMIYHTAANIYFKKTIKDDSVPKGKQ